MFIGPCIVVIVEELKTNLMSLVIFISLIICAANTNTQRKEVCTVQYQIHIQSTSKKGTKYQITNEKYHKQTQGTQKHNI